MKSSIEKKVVLTIGVPVYNAEGYIRSLLEELSKIDNPLIEIVLIDDGSQDKSLSICKEYKNDIIRIYSQKNMGPSETRNKIIKISRGKWITFVDSDDIINPEEYSRIILTLNNKNDWYINVMKKSIYNKIKKLKNKRDLISSLIELEVINSPVTKFYKKDVLIKGNVLFDSSISIGEDLLFNMDYSKKSNSLELLNRDMYIIRENQNSLTRRFNKGKYEELMKVNDDCLCLYNNDWKIKNSLIYIRVKNCLSCLKDYKNNKAKLGDEYVGKIKETKIPNKFILNNMRTTFIYWIWKLLPKKVIIKIL